MTLKWDYIPFMIIIRINETSIKNRINEDYMTSTWSELGTSRFTDI